MYADQSMTGIRGDGTATTGAINISVKDSEAAGNAGAGFNASASGGQSTEMMLNQVVSSNNGTGIRVNGATVQFGNSVITGNATGTSVASGTLSSYGNNQVNGNASDGPNPPVIPLK